MPEETTPKREEPPPQTAGPKKRLTKSQAISVMVVGGVMLVAPWFIPSEQGSTLQLVKTGISLVGFIALCLGVVFPTIGAGLLHLDPELGHYLFVPLDPESKLIPTFLVGKRDTDTPPTDSPRLPGLASTGMAEFS
jgi:hypothetical protein